MTPEDRRIRLDAAIAVAHEAGAIALQHYRNLGALTIVIKGLQDLVSEADRETEDVIKTRLTTLFPEDAFVGEETGADGVDGHRGAWVVDPIDGTQPFLLGLPTWCVSIAYVAEGDIQVGVIFNPVTQDLYTAVRGEGAIRNGAPMRVNEAQLLSEGLTGLGCSARTSAQNLGSIAEHLRDALADARATASQQYRFPVHVLSPDIQGCLACANLTAVAVRSIMLFSIACDELSPICQSASRIFTIRRSLP